jgi:AhpD family alkylhydroperoxidase
MGKFLDLTNELSQTMQELRKLIPGTMSGFSAMAEAANTPKALDKKTKELIALGIAVADRCDGCIGFHTKALVGLQASRDEIAETLAVAIYMGGGPSVMYAAEALRSFDEFASQG